ncbi:Protein of unknown function [Sulfitobacter delicatus]|jgi:hypothetical protein|uniref:Uncharacterized protein n=1 Tax=Sulfitobacter delicatus TaxID=218672 RepID=A0A1G7Z075_9RHOB|nr:Protein of unknown function [Sulfitobacter delicatus]
MDSVRLTPALTAASAAHLPGWALARGRAAGELEAAFAAGIALKSLDDLVRIEPVWAGCWRARQALKCATAAVRLLGRGADEAALRDAVALTAPGDDPGPAGRVLLATKRLSARNPASPRKGFVANPLSTLLRHESSSVSEERVHVFRPPFRPFGNPAVRTLISGVQSELA